MKGTTKGKAACLLAAALVLLLVFSGCGGVLYGEKQQVQQDAAVSGKLTLNGSTSMAKVCQALGEAFSQKHPGVTVETSGTGSGDAPGSVLSGNALVGNLSRAMKDSENPQDFEQVLLAIDGIALAVHPQNPVTNLTSEQVTKIFAGEITNWKEVGGDDQPITRLGRESSSGTRDGFETLFQVEGCRYAAELTSTGEVLTRVSSDPSAIGYLSLESLNDSVRALSIDGVEPTEAHIRDGSYPVSRPFLQVYKKGSDSPLIAAWFAFVQSEEGDAIIEGAGLIPAQPGASDAKKEEAQ